MTARSTAMATSLTPEQRALIDETILRSFKTVGSPLKLAEIAAYVGALCAKLIPGGGTYEFYRWCDAAVQRLKREGRLELVRGKGGGWRRI